MLGNIASASESKKGLQLSQAVWKYKKMQIIIITLGVHNAYMYICPEPGDMLQMGFKCIMRKSRGIEVCIEQG